MQVNSRFDWAVALIVTQIPFILMVSKWDHDREVNEKLALCFSYHPEWAAEFFDPKTPKENVAVISDTCLN